MEFYALGCNFSSLRDRSYFLRAIAGNDTPEFLEDTDGVMTHGARSPHTTMDHDGMALVLLLVFAGFKILRVSNNRFHISMSADGGQINELAKSEELFCPMPYSLKN
ncbi:hypothetical protein FD723_13335 [Nostoc sp. C052]|uniref:hypothetical protein n=1 Tax=Nostoc sp. C052 TaxID=2576902 RepID=UPI0015C30F43|nr:hypothetical protein [Nostoc sp. C052]QLE41324.1 hypothetical protein FD723_13335 [Nostoc sp. C052]